MKNNLTPQDLRVGNLVELLTTQSKIVGRTGCYAEVLEIRKDKVQLKYKEHIFMRKYDSIAPIKINEELLFELGLKKHEKYNVFLLSNSFAIDYYKGDEFAIYYLDDQFCEIIRIKYIHQLQNFFYAFTLEEELILKSTINERK